MDAEAVAEAAVAVQKVTAHPDAEVVRKALAAAKTALTGCQCASSQFCATPLDAVSLTFPE